MRSGETLSLWFEKMKDILKNKSVAAVICAVLIFLGIFMGVRRPIGNMKEDALVYFYGDEEIIGIKQDLESKVETAYSLMSVAKKYIAEDDKLISDLTKACEEVRESDSPKKAGKANAVMDNCYLSLKTALDGKNLSQKDADYNKSLLSQYNSSDMIISHSEYNVLAGEVNETLSRFPANILSKIAFVGKMELYE